MKIIKKSIDRKDLFFSMQQIHHISLTDFEDFRFLIFVFNVNISLIKIIVYEDFINNLVHMKKTLIRFYTKVEASSSKINQVIRCYNEKMFETKKFKIYENFMKEDFIIQILCVTNVMKLDMNILDVNIIIQWKKSFSMRTLMQRIDRVAKKLNRFDEFIWFHFVWCKEERAATSTRNSKFNQWRQIMNINDKFDSKFELNEQKKSKRRNNNSTKKLKWNNVLWWKMIFDVLSMKKFVFVKSFSRSSMNLIWRICFFIDTKRIVVFIARKTKISLRKSIYVYVFVSTNLKQRHSIINARQWKKHWKFDEINANRTSSFLIT